MATLTEEQQGIVDALSGVGVDEQQARFIVSLDLTGKEQGALAGAILNITDPNSINNAMRDIIAAREPEQLVESLEVSFPDMKSLTDLLKANPNLAEAFHNAITKDPSMLPGLQEMAGRESGFDVDAFAGMLDSEAKINLATGLLNKISENPDDDFDFNFLDKLANALVTATEGETPEERAAAEQQAREMVTEAGLDISEVETEEVMALFSLMRENPNAFAEKAAILMGLDPASSPETIDALEFFAETFATLLGPYIDLIEHYYPQAADYFTRLTGEWDGSSAPTADSSPNTPEGSGLPLPNANVPPTADTMRGLHAQGADIRTSVDARGTFDRAGNGEVDPEDVSANPAHPPIDPTVPTNPQDTPALGR